MGWSVDTDSWCSELSRNPAAQVWFGLHESVNSFCWQRLILHQWHAGIAACLYDTFSEQTYTIESVGREDADLWKFRIYFAEGKFYSDWLKIVIIWQLICCPVCVNAALFAYVSRWFDLIFILLEVFYINLQEAKKALIKDIGPVNRVHLTFLVTVENIMSQLTAPKSF